MPIIASGGNATIAVAANQILTVQCQNGAEFTYENPVGTKVLDSGSNNVFGPFAVATSVKVNSIQGQLFYEVATPPVATSLGYFSDSNGNTTGLVIGIGPVVPLGVNASLSYSRGDSITVGYGLTSASQAYGAVFSTKYGLTHTNFGNNSTGALTQFTRITANTSRQTQTNNQLSVWLCGYNDMRSGNSAGRLSAFRGVVGATALLMVAKLSAFRNYYNGGGGGTGLGAPAGSLVSNFSAGIGSYGNGTDWRGLPSTTNGQTHSSTINGSVVYVIYDRFKTNTGGTFSVAIDGVVVIPNVSCDGTNLGLEQSIDQPVADNAGNGYPTLLRIPTNPGKHTVLITVTSATAATNKVQIEAVAGNDDAIGGNTLIIANTLRMNATGYAGSTAAYASQAIGDAAVKQYQQVLQDVASQLQQDGFKVFCADTSNYDPTIAANIQADNIHPTAAGQALISAAVEQVYLGAHQVTTASGGGDLQVPTLPASPAVYQNTSKVRQQVFLTGGTTSLLELSRDGLVYVTIGTVTPFMLILSPNDSLRVTYSVVPTATVVPV